MMILASWEILLGDRIMPQISIIMPCHNGEKYLSDSITSVISQTYTDWELLVINDNSTDNSVNMIENFCKKDARIKLLRTEKSSGMPATPRNVGINVATGRFIAFLDCDDMWLPTKLEHQLPLFETKNVAVVFSYYAKMNDTGDFQNRLISSPFIVTYEYLLKGDCIGNLTGMYDTRKCGKVFQKEIHHEDYDMWLSILKQGSYAINTNTYEAFYRIQKKSVSSNKLKTMQWHWNILRKEQKLPFRKSIEYFMHYAVRGFLKFLK